MDIFKKLTSCWRHMATFLFNLLLPMNTSYNAASSCHELVNTVKLQCVDNWSNMLLVSHFVPR